MVTVKGIRWCPGRGYEISRHASPCDSPGHPISDDVAKTAPYTLGGERLDHTAMRFPWTWCVVHSSKPWAVQLPGEEVQP